MCRPTGAGEGCIEPKPEVKPNPFFSYRELTGDSVLRMSLASQPQDGAKADFPVLGDQSNGQFMSQGPK